MLRCFFGTKVHFSFFRGCWGARVRGWLGSEMGQTFWNTHYLIVLAWRLARLPACRVQGSVVRLFHFHKWLIFTQEPQDLRLIRWSRLSSFLSRERGVWCIGYFISKTHQYFSRALLSITFKMRSPLIFSLLELSSWYHPSSFTGLLRHPCLRLLSQMLLQVSIFLKF